MGNRAEIFFQLVGREFCDKVHAPNAKWEKEWNDAQNKIGAGMGNYTQRCIDLMLERLRKEIATLNAICTKLTKELDIEWKASERKQLFEEHIVDGRLIGLRRLFEDELTRLGCRTHTLNEDGVRELLTRFDNGANAIIVAERTRIETQRIKEEPRLSSPKQKRKRGRSRNTITKATIVARILGDNKFHSDRNRDICRAWDNHHPEIPVTPKLKKAGFDSWVRAYESENFRSLVQKHISELWEISRQL